MALPAGRVAMGSFKGAKGNTGSLAFATAETVAWTDDPEVEMIGPEDDRGAHFKIPMPLPSPATVNNDDATEALVKTPTKTQKAVDGRLETGMPAKTSLIAQDVIVGGPLARANAIQQAMISKRLVANKSMPNKQILLNGATAEAWARTGGVVVSDDVTHVISGGKSFKFTIPAAASDASGYIQFAAPVAIHPSQAMYAWLWIDNPAVFNSITVEIRRQTGSVLYQRSNLVAPAQPLVAGWNKFRWNMCEGLPASWDSTPIDRVRIYTPNNAAATISIGEVGLEWHAKAKMIFVLDRGYESFVNGGGVADLDALGIPITWAVDIQKIGDRPGNPIFNAVTLDYLRTRAAKGDSISFHGYTSNPTSTMTPEQLVLDTIQSQAWARQNGFVGATLWRAAMVQDTALPASAAAAGAYMLGQAQWSMPAYRLDSWPPRNMKNIIRTPGMDGLTTAYMDVLKRTRGLMVLYQHGIQEGYVNDATPAEWTAWRDALTTALSEGWFEATTFEDLYIDSQSAFA